MKKRVLFLCTANSARSQMAEALLRHMAADQFDVLSAGTQPEAIDPRTIDALTGQGFNVSSLKSTALGQVQDKDFDFVISLCEKAHEDCKTWPGKGTVMAWDFADPRSSKDPHAFNKTLLELKDRLSLFIQVNQKEISPLPSLSPVSFFKQLADENRLKSLLLISQIGELCVCELMQALQESQPKTSRHLAQLRKQGLLLDRRQGQWVYYRLNPDLPSWMLETIKTTAIANEAFIAEGIEQLANMSNRPDNAPICG